MPRKCFLANPTAPYHVVARTTNKDWFNVPLPLLWDIFSDYLHLIHSLYEVEILSFVLMSNHYHMLIYTPHANLPQAMNYLQREVSKQINLFSGRINQVFGGPYNWSMISDNRYFLTAYKYVYRNPVDAHLCSSVINYKYSTLHGLLGFNRLIIPLRYDELLFSDLEEHLKWLDQPFPRQNMRQEIRNAMRHRQMRFGRDRDRMLPSLSAK
jgi:REP element-mobilizing transposase RayT